jgi:hypothetical protein
MQHQVLNSKLAVKTHTATTYATELLLFAVKQLAHRT